MKRRNVIKKGRKTPVSEDYGIFKSQLISLQVKTSTVYVISHMLKFFSTCGKPYFWHKIFLLYGLLTDILYLCLICFGGIHIASA